MLVEVGRVMTTQVSDFGLSSSTEDGSVFQLELTQPLPSHVLQLVLVVHFECIFIGWQVYHIVDGWRKHHMLKD